MTLYFNTLYNLVSLKGKIYIKIESDKTVFLYFCD